MRFPGIPLRPEKGHAMHSLFSFLFIFFISVLWAPVSYADFEFKFKDGSTLVWPKYSEKGDKYCTQMSYGEFCVLKSDVVSIQKTDAEADEAYRAKTKTLSEKEQKDLIEKRKEQDNRNWKSIEESQRRRAREEAEARRKRSTSYYDYSHED